MVVACFHFHGPHPFHPSHFFHGPVVHVQTLTSVRLYFSRTQEVPSQQPSPTGRSWRLSSSSPPPSFPSSPSARNGVCTASTPLAWRESMRELTHTLSTSNNTSTTLIQFQFLIYLIPYPSVHSPPSKIKTRDEGQRERDCERETERACGIGFITQSSSIIIILLPITYYIYVITYLCKSLYLHHSATPPYCTEAKGGGCDDDAMGHVISEERKREDAPNSTPAFRDVHQGVKPIYLSISYRIS